MQQPAHRITRFAEVASAWLLAAVASVVLVEVLFRYVLHLAAPWTGELARYLSVWMVYVGTVVATIRKDHIKLTVLVDRLGARGRTAVEVLAVIVGMLVSVIVFFGSIQLIINNWRQTAVTIPVSVAVLYAPLTVFSVVSFAALCERVIEIARGAA